MRNDIVNNVRLDVNREKNKDVIYVRVGDTKTRIIHFTIVNKGVVINLEDVMIALITINKPDGTHCYNDLVRSGNELQYTITSQSINVPGECKCTIELTFKDGSFIGIPGFSIMVYEKYLSDKVIESTNEYKGVTAQVVLASKSAETASDAAEQCKASEETASVCANTANALLGLFRGEKAENDEFVKNSMEVIETSRTQVENNTLATQQNTEAVSNMKDFVEVASAEVNQKAKEILSDTNLAKGYAEQASKSAETASDAAEQCKASEENSEKNKNDAGVILDEINRLQVQCENLKNECNNLYENLVGMGMLELGTTHATAYYGDLGKIAYDHSQSKGNPHVTTYSDVGADQAGAAQAVYENAIAYTDKAIADLINGAPNTLDTLREVADAMIEHEEIVAALEAAIGSKADATETSSLINQLDARVDILEDNNGYPIS